MLCVTGEANWEARMDDPIDFSLFDLMTGVREEIGGIELEALPPGRMPDIRLE